METQVAALKCDLAEMYGWTPDTINHLTIQELLFWRDRGGAEISHAQAMRIWERQQRRKRRGEPDLE